MPEELRVVIHLAILCQLRRAEIMGIRRMGVDTLHGTVAIRETRTRKMDGSLVVKGPKSKAGQRDIAVASSVSKALLDHVRKYVDPEPCSALVPVTPRKLDLAWHAARISIGRPNLRLHDPRHTGLTLAGATGATVRELMHRGGHSTPTAAIRYQHATRDRDRVIADALAELVKPAAVVPIGGKKRASKARLARR